MGIDFLCCSHGNKGIGTHNVVCNIFAITTQDVDFHVGWEQLHVFLSVTLNSSCWWIDIVLITNGIFTLANIVITNPMCANLLPRSCTTQRFATSNAFQAKEMNYCNQHPNDQFFPLVIEIFWCLHKHVDVFLHECANVIWSLKRPEGPPLFVLVTFLRQRISITLQRMQTSSILSQVVAICLTTSTPLGHNPHLYDWTITSDRLLR
jgi:hypothetical protein